MTDATAHEVRDGSVVAAALRTIGTDLVHPYDGRNVMEKGAATAMTSAIIFEGAGAHVHLEGTGDNVIASTTVTASLSLNMQVAL